jgi:hypothetical protein
VKASIILPVVGMFSVCAALADGGNIQLHKTSGSFVLTVFTSPEPLRVGLIDTSVLVQDRATGAAILEATVNFDVHPPGDITEHLWTRGTPVQAANRLLHAFTINPTVSGWWTIRVFVSHHRQEAAVTTKVFVIPASPRLTRIWPFLVAPLFCIALFAVHQMLQHSGSSRSQSERDLRSKRLERLPYQNLFL